MYTPNPNQSPTANRGWQRVFQRGKLTLGIMFPIEAFERAVLLIGYELDLEHAFLKHARRGLEEARRRAAEAGE